MSHMNCVKRRGRESPAGVQGLANLGAINDSSGNHSRGGGTRSDPWNPTDLAQTLHRPCTELAPRHATAPADASPERRRRGPRAGAEYRIRELNPPVASTAFPIWGVNSLYELIAWVAALTCLIPSIYFDHVSCRERCGPSKRL